MTITRDIPISSGQIDRSRTWIKVCGVRDAATSAVICDAGADALGLNFYDRSLRYVTSDLARRVAEPARGRLSVVGVFVNAPPATIARMVAEVGLTHVQIHGDETPLDVTAIAEAVPGVPLIRAWRVGDEGLESVATELRELEGRGTRLWAALVDARVPGEYGGSGQKAPWSVLSGGWRSDWPPLILAGGLTPANVGPAIREVHPWGVDTASGVERAAGCKDAVLIRQFVAKARAGV